MALPLTPFQESLKVILVEREHNAKARSSDVTAFYDEWTRIRRDTLNPVLEEAAAYLRTAGVHSVVKNENGDSTSLVCGRYTLSFTVDSSELKINCSCPPILPEVFEVDKLNKARVEDKVREFARVIEI